MQTVQAKTTFKYDEAPFNDSLADVQNNERCEWMRALCSQ